MATISDAEIRVYTTLSSNNADGFLKSVYDNPGATLYLSGACQAADEPHHLHLLCQDGAFKLA